jgi:Peptidase family M1 domain
MKNFILLITILLITCSNNIYAQDYFQQEVNFNIKVKLNDNTHFLSAYEEITYINHSPDTLSFVWMHLWPNAYLNNETPFAQQQMYMRNEKFYNAPISSKGFIDSLDFHINGKPVIHSLLESAVDIAKIILPEKLLPGDSIKITTPFRVKIPEDFSRLGHDGQSYQITQWFPKPAVYDCEGWHPMSYLDMGEFYSEFGNFHVEITIPENYVVGATGTLKNNPTEEERLSKLIDLTNNSDNIEILSSDEIPSSKKMKIISFEAKTVHDFAWFADKSFLMSRDTVVLNSGKEIQTNALYLRHNLNDWENAVDYVSSAIQFYSVKFGEYLYPQATAVCGALSAGGGMEYPMITVISSSLYGSPEEIIVHEVGHNWFYGFLANDERDHPWLDEGINTFADNWYSQSKNPSSILVYKKKEPLLEYIKDENRLSYYAYLYPARFNNIQALTSKSDEFSMINYGAILYMTGALSFRYLKEYLGEEEFVRIMKVYYNKWKYKHPQPEDFVSIFNEESSQDLDWFFNDFISTTKKIDYKISSVRKNKNNDSLSVKIKNNGNIIAPIPFEIVKDDSIIYRCWINGFEKENVIQIPDFDADYYFLDYAEIVPEIRRNNNRYKGHSIFPKTEKLKLAPIYNFDNSKQRHILFLPTMGWNNYNKYMLGVMFYNDPVFLNKIDYRLTPMYAFGDNSISFFGNIGLNVLPNNTIFNRIRIGVPISYFSYDEYDNQALNCTRIAPEIRFHIRNKKNPQQRIYSEILIRHVNITKEAAVWNFTDAEMNIKPRNYYVNNIRYTYQNKNLLQAKSLIVDFQQNQEIIKLSLDASIFINYKNSKKGFKIRSFMGSFLWENSTSNIDYRYRISGSTGADDYLFDYIFLGRNESYNNILSQQFVDDQGGFSINTAYGQSWNWVWTVNLTSDLPGKIPFEPYLNIGTYGDAFKQESTQNILYEGGIKLPIIKNVFEISFPVFYSKNIKDNVGLMYDNYLQKIRFTLRFDLLNPYLYIDRPETIISF